MLTPLQAQIAEIVKELPESEAFAFAFAGAGALLVHRLIDRRGQAGSTHIHSTSVNTYHDRSESTRKQM